VQAPGQRLIFAPGPLLIHHQAEPLQEAQLARGRILRGDRSAMTEEQVSAEAETRAAAPFPAPLSPLARG
jgi:hypothetical protein